MYVIMVLWDRTCIQYTLCIISLPFPFSSCYFFIASLCCCFNFCSLSSHAQKYESRESGSLPILPSVAGSLDRDISGDSGRSTPGSRVSLHTSHRSTTSNKSLERLLEKTNKHNEPSILELIEVHVHGLHSVYCSRGSAFLLYALMYMRKGLGIFLENREKPAATRN